MYTDSRGEKYCFGFSGQKRKRRALASSTTQARPSLRFSPVMALHRKICQRCVRISSSCNACKLLLAPDAAVAVWCVQTFEMSSPVMHPLTSVLFANTSRLAPESRFSPFCQLRPSVRKREAIGLTSSWRRPCSSSLQSWMRKRSVASTTHIRASVFSK